MGPDIHPGLVVLPALAAGLALALALSRRRAASLDRLEPRAALFYGLVASAFLWPALMIPDGVPSPSASLFLHPPWKSLADAPDPATGNGALPDVTYQIQPWLLLLKSQLRSGELPLWNPHSFLGQPFWANGQSAPLYPLHLLFAALPTLWGFLLLPWLRLVVGALGTRRLALALGLRPGGALLAGVVFPLSGMVTGNLLFPMANALVMVPWVLWATERLLADGESCRRGRWRALAVCVALLALAGHPGTLAHCLLLSVVYLAVRLAWTERLWKRLGSWLAGWTTGGAVAMVQLLPVALYLPQTTRWGDPGGPPPPPGPPWTQVLPMTLRLLQPWVYGRAETGTWHGSFYEPASRVFVGLLALLLALVALQSILSRRLEGSGDRRRLAVAVLLAFSALVAYRTPVVLQLVELLPIVGRAPPHRLLFGVDLCLALLAGLGLDRLTDVPRRIWRAAALVAAGFAVLVVVVARVGELALSDVLANQRIWLLWLAVAAALLLSLARLPRRIRRGLLLLPILLAAAELTVAHAPSVPGLSVAWLYPATGAIDYLEGRPGNVAGIGSTLRPGTSVVYGLHDLRGDDPARPRRHDAMYRHLGSIETPFFHPVDEWHHPWLDEAGVRWVITPPRRRPPVAGWRLAYDGDAGRVYERPEARPEAWLANGGSTTPLRVSRPSNDRVRVEGPIPAERRLVVSQAWAPGWTARLGDRTLETIAHDDFLLAVDLPGSPAGTEAVELVYRPPGFVLGAGISAAALLLLLASLVVPLNPRRGTTRMQEEAGRQAASPPAV